MKIALNLLSLMLDKCSQCWWCLLSLATKVVSASLVCGRWIEVKIDCLLILQPFKSQGNLASIMVPNFHRLFPPDSQDFFFYIYLDFFLCSCSYQLVWEMIFLEGRMRSSPWRTQPVSHPRVCPNPNQSIQQTNRLTMTTVTKICWHSNRIQS